MMLDCWKYSAAAKTPLWLGAEGSAPWQLMAPAPSPTPETDHPATISNKFRDESIFVPLDSCFSITTREHYNRLPACFLLLLTSAMDGVVTANRFRSNHGCRF